MRAELGESGRLEPLSIEAGGARLEVVLVAFGRILAREGFEERYPPGQFRQAGQTAPQVAGGEVMQHVAAHQQVDRRARPQQGEVGEVREMQVAAAAITLDRIVTA